FHVNPFYQNSRMPLFCQYTPPDTGKKKQHEKAPGLPPTHITCADEKDQWNKEMRENQTKPQAMAWSLTYLWINSFRCHLLLTPKQAGI
ncbi:hypothetical protein, partial [Sulfurovum sp.]|uniref:hypothetical protein n=1 Tax=Sulfurovum sp. TaxID=1969726 RepID=UPI00356178BC